MSRLSSTDSPRALLFLLALVLLVIGPASSQATDDSMAAATEAQQAQLEAADRRFNQAARERDRKTFHDLLSKDSVFLAGELQSGRLAVMAIWQHLFEGKYDFRYDAELLEATVAQSGEIGWSIGTVRTSFTRPGLDTPEETEGHYLHVWKRNGEGAWQLSHSSTLVVHPTLGAARDPRSGLMTAWPELADQIGAEIDLQWSPDQVLRAESGELAVTFGEYEASFLPPSAEKPELTASPGRQTGSEEGAEPEKDSEEAAEPDAITGKGHFLAIWQKDTQGRWQLAAEGFTPPGIYGAN